MVPLDRPSPSFERSPVPWLRSATRLRIVTACLVVTVACGGHQVDLPGLPSGTTVNAMIEDGNRRLRRRDREGALARMRQAVEAEPDNPVTHLHLANALRANSDMSEARKALARARSLGRNTSDRDELQDQLRQLAFWIARDEANLLLYDEKWEEALERYDEALGFEPDDAKVHLRKSWLLRSYALDKKGDPDEALELLDQALHARDRALELDPDSEDIQNELYWIQNTIGVVLKENGEHPAALRMFERALAGAPDSPMVTRNYGRGLLEYAKDRDGAVRDSLLHRAKVAAAAAVKLAEDRTYSDRLFRDIAAEEAGFWGNLATVGKAALGALSEIDRGTQVMNQTFARSIVADVERMEAEVKADVGIAPSSTLGESALTWEQVFRNLQNTNERLSRKAAELAARNRQQLASMMEESRRREEAERQQALQRQQEAQRRRQVASRSPNGGPIAADRDDEVDSGPQERRAAEREEQRRREEAERQRRATERRAARQRAERERQLAERRQREAAERRRREAAQRRLAAEKAKLDGFLQNARVMQFAVHSACHGEHGRLAWQLEVEGYDSDRVSGAWFNPNRIIKPRWDPGEGIVHQSGGTRSTYNMPLLQGRVMLGGSPTDYSPVVHEQSETYSITYDARRFGNMVPVTFRWEMEYLDGRRERRSARVSVVNGGTYAYRGQPTASSYRCGEQRIDIVR